MFLKTNKKGEKIKLKVFSRNNNNSIINNINTNEQEKNCIKSILEPKEYESPQQSNKKYKIKLNNTNVNTPEDCSSFNNNENTEKSVFYQNNINAITNFNFIDLYPKSKKEYKLKLAAESFKTFNESINNMLSLSHEKTMKKNDISDIPIKNNSRNKIKTQSENNNIKKRCYTSFEISNLDAQKKFSRNVLSDDKDNILKKDENYYLRTCTVINESPNNTQNFLLPLIDNNTKNTNNNNNQNLYNSNKKISIFDGDNPLEFSFGEQKTKKENKNINTVNTTKAKNILNKQFLSPLEKSEKSQKKYKNFNSAFRYKKLQTFNTHLTEKNRTLHNNVLNIEPKQIDFLSTTILDIQFPEYPTVKYSKQEINEHIKCYAVNTYKGLHSSNEDKVSIILTISKPKNFKGYWPKCSFIALYDGKFGKNCSKFLRDKLHHFIFNNDYFPKNPKKAIIYGYEKAEKKFMEFVKNNPNEKSGSCSLTIIIIDNIIYVGNCGNSHGILSMNEGKNIINLNKIHILSDNIEKKRIENSGAQIVKSKKGEEKIIPGKLNITRGVGFAYLKNPELGGKKGIYISTPEINEYKINDNEFDFLILASNSIFEQLSVEESIESIFKVICDQENLYIDSIHQLAGASVDMLLKTSLVKGAQGNVTCIFIGFKNLENFKNKKKFSGKGILKDFIDDENNNNESANYKKKKGKSLRIKNQKTINKKVYFEENDFDYIKKVAHISDEEDNKEKLEKNKKEKENENENKQVKDENVSVIALKKRRTNLKLTIRKILSNITEDDNDDKKKK